MHIKVLSSCIRGLPVYVPPNSILRHHICEGGDLVIVKCVDDFGAYVHVENEHGRDVRLYKHDVFIGVIANRFSGTNVSGFVPREPISTGSRLHLLSQSGVVGLAEEAPAYYKPALALEAIGFPTDSGNVINISRSLLHKKSDVVFPKKKPIIVVCGTSAEAGKTTIVTQFCRHAKSLYPDLTLAAGKVFGTGRLRDKLSFCDAGYDYALDFVDFGFATTYGISDLDIAYLVNDMIDECQNKADVVCIEIGGDLIEQGVFAVLDALPNENVSFILAANDPMGAREGIRILEERNRKVVAVSCFRQNLSSFAKRLGMSSVSIVDALNGDNMSLIVKAAIARS